MKKLVIIVIILLCCNLLLLDFNKSTKYQRISFDGETLGEELAHHVNAETVVANKSKDTFSSTFPIYEISYHAITQEDYAQLQADLELPDNPVWLEIGGNSLYFSLASYVDSRRGYFTMTDEEAEQRAWEIFNRIPFIDGEYECIGIRDTFTISNSEGEHIARAGVVFCRVLDGIRVVGNDSCTIYFDGSGLVAISIQLYDYEHIGTMEMVPLNDAVANLKTPDAFTMDTQKTGAGSIAETLQIDMVALRFANQYSSGCTILQPVYVFTGTATLKDKSQAEFGAKIIAIPEKYTYEKE